MRRRGALGWTIAGLVSTTAVLAVVLVVPRLQRTIIDRLQTYGCPPEPAATAQGPPFDPLTRPVKIGYFPEPMTAWLTRISLDNFETSYKWRDIGLNRLPIATELELRVWRAGRDPFGDTATDIARHGVEPINGGQAVWLPDAGLLRWELEPRMWAEVRLVLDLVNADVEPAQPFPAPPLAVVRRVAESVTTAGAEPVKLPWRLPKLTTGLAPVSVQILEEPEQYAPWSAELVFGYEGRSCPAAMIVRSDGSAEHSGDRTVHVATDRNATTLTATGGGARHSVYAVAPEPADSFGDGGVRSFFDRMEIFGEPSAWQTGTLTDR